MTTADIAANSDVAVVRAGFEAFANGDLAALAELFHEDATWNHRNPDRLGGLHRGWDQIAAFLAESGELTEGTLRVVPELVMADGDGHVALTVRVSATRPDGRSFDDPQMVLFTVESGRVRSVEQFVGDPPAVTAFWD